MVDVKSENGKMQVAVKGSGVDVLAECLGATHAMYEVIEKHDNELAELFVDMLENYAQDIVVKGVAPKPDIDMEALDELEKDIDNLLGILKKLKEED